MENFDFKANAPEKSCDDVNCPYHGNLKVRGRLVKGFVKSSKMDKTVVVEYEFLRYFPKYNRYGKSKTRLFAHNPSCVGAQVGERVLVGETRPISKAKNFVVLKVIDKKNKSN